MTYRSCLALPAPALLALLLGSLLVPRLAWGAEMPTRGGSIVVKVTDYEAARADLLRDAGAQGAEMLGAKTLVDGKGRKHGWLRFRLPSAQLPALLASAQARGRLYGENVTTTDHASEYEELARRVARLREHQGRLAGILSSNRRLRGGDLLYVQERLFRASVDESLLEQRRADLERDTQTNTLSVELFEPGALPPSPHPSRLDLGAWFGRARGLALASWERQLARGATASAYALVFAPLWLPALIVGGLLLRLLWRRRARIADAALQAVRRLVEWITLARAALRARSLDAEALKASDAG